MIAKHLLFTIHRTIPRDMYTKLNKRASWKSQFEETHCLTAAGTHLNAKGLAQATVSTVHGFNPYIGISCSSEDGKEGTNVKTQSEGQDKGMCKMIFLKQKLTKKLGVWCGFSVSCSEN